MIGAGGLGSPAGVYLAAAGVGTLGIVDSDTVDLSNLQRQILHYTADVSKLKVDSAIETIQAMNPDVNVIRHAFRLDESNVMDIFNDYDVIVDGTDNFAKITFIYPPRETPTAATEFVSERAFVQFDMSTELLSIVRRSNKQAIESEGTGVVITRLVE